MSILASLGRAAVQYELAASFFGGERRCYNPIGQFAPDFIEPLKEVISDSIPRYYDC